MTDNYSFTVKWSDVMKPNGLCLLKRKEIKFAIDYKHIPNFIKFILKQKNFKQETFDWAKQIEMHNMVFDVPDAKALDVYFRSNYSRARVRSYRTKEYVSHYWGEWRSKQGEEVKKKRKLLKSTKAIVNFLEVIRKKGLVFANFSSYLRQSFNNKNRGVRITVDKSIVYLNNEFVPVTNKIFRNNHTAIIKFKFCREIVFEDCELLDWVRVRSCKR